MIKSKKIFNLCLPRGFYETFKIDFFRFYGKHGFNWCYTAKRFSWRENPSGLAYLHLNKE